MKNWRKKITHLLSKKRGSINAPSPLNKKNLYFVKGCKIKPKTLFFVQNHLKTTPKIKAPALVFSQLATIGGKSL
jgi:hypothetical protein